jgi:dTDP-glucose 4,6-dehydratase
LRTLITGGAGFIGSNFIHRHLTQFEKIVVLDKLTYAGDRANLEPLLSGGKIEFVAGDINDRMMVLKLLQNNRIDSLIHFAAESHVDNSILGPEPFLRTNILGTFSLLEAMREYLSTPRENFRYLHVSTDEVFGSLGSNGTFQETSPYQPNSPYSASKAASDHLVRAWGHTFGIPFIITNCSNNYGPRQHREKLIPTVLRSALDETSIPVYGEGKNIRDWIFVDDHNDGIFLALTKGRIGECYCFGAQNESDNLSLVQRICDGLMEFRRPTKVKHYRDLIRFVKDRPGHDFRYAIDSSKARKELGFEAKMSDFDIGLPLTIRSYL